MTLISHGRLNGRRFYQVFDPDTGRAALWICLECRGEFEPDAASFEAHDCWNYKEAPRPKVKRSAPPEAGELDPPTSAEDLAGSYVRDLEERLALVTDPQMIRDAMEEDQRTTAAPLYRTRLDELEASGQNPEYEEE